MTVTVIEQDESKLKSAAELVQGQAYKNIREGEIYVGCGEGAMYNGYPIVAFSIKGNHCTYLNGESDDDVKEFLPINLEIRFV